MRCAVMFTHRSDLAFSQNAMPPWSSDLYTCCSCATMSSYETVGVVVGVLLTSAAMATSAAGISHAVSLVAVFCGARVEDMCGCVDCAHAAVHTYPVVGLACCRVLHRCPCSCCACLCLFQAVDDVYGMWHMHGDLPKKRAYFGASACFA